MTLSLTVLGGSPAWPNRGPGRLRVPDRERHAAHPGGLRIGRGIGAATARPRAADRGRHQSLARRPLVRPGAAALRDPVRQLARAPSGEPAPTARRPRGARHGGVGVGRLGRDVRRRFRHERVRPDRRPAPRRAAVHLRPVPALHHLLLDPDRGAREDDRLLGRHGAHRAARRGLPTMPTCSCARPHCSTPRPTRRSGVTWTRAKRRPQRRGRDVGQLLLTHVPEENDHEAARPSSRAPSTTARSTSRDPACGTSSSR